MTGLYARRPRAVIKGGRIALLIVLGFLLAVPAV